MTLSRGEWAVLAFNLIAIGGFFTYFTLISNREFMGYIVTMLALIAVVALVHRMARLPVSLLWALSLWGVAHMAGGSVPVNGSVLYNMMIFPIMGQNELRVLKYDQVVHFYGFAVTAWLMWHVLSMLHPVLRNTRTIYVVSALASMGLGAANEIIEFTAVLLVPNTNVGGYYNTGLDLVFNALGAITAMLICAITDRRSASHLPRR